MKKTSLIFCLLLAFLTFTSCKNQDLTSNEASTVFDSCVSQTQEQTAFLQTSAEASTTAFENETTLSFSQSTSLPTTQTITTQEVTTTLASTSNTILETTASPVTTTEAKKTNYCYVSIFCNTVNDNLDTLKKSKKEFVAPDGIIIENVPVEVEDGDSVFEIIKKACSENTCKQNCKYCQKSGIQIEYTYTPTFDNYYIEGIHQLYEKDCTMQSGWMYSVNSQFPNVGVSAYDVKAGDKIVFAYTCNMGEDIGNVY